MGVSSSIKSGLLPSSLISSTIFGLRNFLDWSTKYGANSTSKLLSTGTIEVVVAVLVTDPSSTSRSWPVRCMRPSQRGLALALDVRVPGKGDLRPEKGWSETEYFLPHGGM
jgi:hypothetical protein